MFADRLKNLMLKKRMNSKTLAEILNIPEEIVIEWLQGKIDPTCKIVKLCETLRCNADYLLGLTRYNNSRFSNDIYLELQYHQGIVERLKREIRNKEREFDFLTVGEHDYKYCEDNSYIEKLKSDLEKGYFF